MFEINYDPPAPDIPPTPDSGNPPPENDRFEVLKALYDASLNRWEKRRNYEWLLSYTIWGALAGFIGIVVFGKDSSFPRFGSAWTAAVCIFSAAIVHAVYLFFIVDGTLRDLESQKLVAEEMCSLVGLIKSNRQNFGDEFKKHQSFIGYAWKIDNRLLVPRHGLIGQSLLTIPLCAVAVWACTRPPQQQTPTPSLPPGATYCQGCPQYFAPLPSAKDEAREISLGQSTSPLKSKKRRHPGKQRVFSRD